MIPTLQDDVAQPLLLFAELPGWLSALMRPGGLEASLRRTVPEIRDGRLELLGCRADRLRAKGEEWLARCRATVRDAGGDEREVVLVGAVVPPGRGTPTTARASGVPFGEPGWEGWFEDLRMHVRVEQSDPGLPALQALLDPSTAGPLLQDLLRRSGYEEAVVRDCQPDVVRYKPGSRCTIVYRMGYEPSASEPSPSMPSGATPPDPVVAKTHQGDKGLFADEAMRALWATPLSSGDVVRIAEPLGYLPDEKVLLQGPVPEDRTLKELAREAFTTADPATLAVLRQALSRTAAALAALHGSGARYSRTATWRGELDEVRGVLDRLSVTVPGLRDAAEPMLRRLEALDAEVPADPVVSAHHDFRPAQVLLAGEDLGFIDFDGAAMAEPALDIGRFRGKLRDIGVSALSAAGGGMDGPVLGARLALLDDLCDEFLAEYRRSAHVTTERVVLWETIDLLTALLHTWTKVRLLRVRPRLAVLVHHLGSTGLRGGALHSPP